MPRRGCWRWPSSYSSQLAELGMMTSDGYDNSAHTTTWGEVYMVLALGGVVRLYCEKQDGIAGMEVLRC
jgi:hypothetical protein